MADSSSSTAGKSAQQSIARSIQGGAYLLLLQLVSRGATFLLNNVVQRLTSIAVVGMASDMELLSGTVLFLSRESLRLALLRGEDDVQDRTTNAEMTPQDGPSPVQDKKGNLHQKSVKAPAVTKQLQLVVNLSYLPLVFGTALNFATLLYHQYGLGSKASYALFVYMMAAVIELASEPMFILCQRNMLHDIRAKVEGFALLLRCIVTLGMTVVPYMLGKAIDSGNPESASPYAWGQFAYACMLVAGYLFMFQKGNVVSRIGGVGSQQTIRRILRPRRVAQIQPNGQKSSLYFDPEQLAIAWSFSFQSALKYALTEGDRILLLWTGQSNAQKGAYKLVSDLGSLIARILFQPIEETARAYFSRTLTGKKAVPKATAMSALHFLKTLLRAQFIIGAYFLFFAPQFAGSLIQILYGGQKSSDSEIVNSLAIYCVYVPFMGINGITEAFFQGVGDSHWIRKQSYWLVYCSFAFAGCSFLTMKMLAFGTSGLILANIVNMLLRIVFCWQFINDFFRTFVDDSSAALTLKKIIPGTHFVRLLFVVAGGLVYFSKEFFGWRSLRALGLHIGVGAVTALVCTYVLWRSEREHLFRDLRNYYSRAKQGKDL
ncbi:Rft protein-domain-containing protein [Phlyctochytrium arcticum]|nr:Rft protein-domain-containing protein [Phlyctochytrium arcticum]